MSPAAANALIAWFACGLAYVEGYRRVGGFIGTRWPVVIGLAAFITVMGPVCWFVLGALELSDRGGFWPRSR